MPKHMKWPCRSWLSLAALALCSLMSTTAWAQTSATTHEQPEQLVTASGCLQREAASGGGADASSGGRFGYVLTNVRIKEQHQRSKDQFTVGAGAATAAGADAAARIRVLPHGKLSEDALQQHLNQQVELQGGLSMATPNMDLSRNSSLTGTTSTSSTPASGTASGGTEPPQQPGRTGATGSSASPTTTSRSGSSTGSGSSGGAAASGAQNQNQSHSANSSASTELMPILRVSAIHASPASAPCSAAEPRPR
jgi:hypothetical protein